MAFSLKLSAALTAQLWKVKVRDKERLEEPHVSIMFKSKTWRFSIRRRVFLDKSPDPKDVPREVVTTIEESIDLLVTEWNKQYPENLV